MGKEVTTISPEGLEVANCYLQYGNIRAVCDFMGVPENQVVEVLNKREVKKYIDTVYLDMGYRNKNNIATVLDEMIASKLEEAQETGVYSSKDLADLLQMAHKMRMDEIKAQADLLKAETTNIRNQTNVQINDAALPFGQGNYGKLMEKLFGGTDSNNKECSRQPNELIILICEYEKLKSKWLSTKHSAKNDGKPLLIVLWILKMELKEWKTVL